MGEVYSARSDEKPSAKTVNLTFTDKKLTKALTIGWELWLVNNKYFFAPPDDSGPYECGLNITDIYKTIGGKEIEINIHYYYHDDNIFESGISEYDHIPITINPNI